MGDEIEIKRIPPTEWPLVTPEEETRILLVYGRITTITTADGVRRYIPPEEFDSAPGAT